MSNAKRTSLITALVAIAAGWVSAADATPQSEQALKLSAVRDCLSATGGQGAWDIYGPATERARLLQGIVIDATSTEISIGIELTGVAPYRITRDKAGTTAQIELAGVIAHQNYKRLVLNADRRMTNLALSLDTLSPQIMSVITIEFSAPVSIQSSYEGSTLNIMARLDGTSPPTLADALAQESALLRSLIRETELRHAAKIHNAKTRCNSILKRLQTELDNTRVTLIEAELSTLENRLPGARASAVGLREEMDSLSSEIHRLREAVARIEHARTQAKDAALHAAAPDIPGVNTSEQIALARAVFQDIGQAAVSVEETAAGRFAKLASAAESRTDAIGELARQIDAFAYRSFPLESQDSFARLDRELESIRLQDGAQRGSFAELDIALSTIAFDEPLLVVEPAAHAAVRTGGLDLHALNAPPAKRASVALPRPAALPAVPLGFGKITVHHPTKDPIRLAQNQTRKNITFSAKRAPSFTLYREGVPPEEDPLQQPVTIDFRDMDLSNVVSLLAEKGEINVIAGTDVRGTVTANLTDIPLGRAIETILRMNGLGIVEEAGVYRITTYEEAIESRRETRLIFLQNVSAEEVEETIQTAVRGPDSSRFSVSANEETNVLVLSGPSDLVNQMVSVVEQLDVTEQVIPTVTKVIKLNYARPIEIENIIDQILTDEGEVDVDERSRQIVVTDLPGKVREIEDLIRLLDIPVKQVRIEATIVDAVMDDTAQTGVDWVLSRLPTGRLESASFSNSFRPSSLGSTIGLNLLSGDFDLDLLLLGEIQSNNAEVLASPTITTLENVTARIAIAEEIPYQELTQTAAGGAISSTSFKSIGTTLAVTPRVTHNNQIIIAIDVQQSDTSGFTPDLIPIEDERLIQTTLRLNDGQTVFIGGLRKFDDSLSSRKTPILGDIPILGVLFGNRNSVQERVELLVFLTCNVVPNDLPELTPFLQRKYDMIGGRTFKPNASRTLVDSYIHSDDYRDPFYKWRRDK